MVHFKSSLITSSTGSSLGPNSSLFVINPFPIKYGYKNFHNLFASGNASEFLPIVARLYFLINPIGIYTTTCGTVSSLIDGSQPYDSPANSNS